MGVEAALNSIAKLGIVGILVGVLRGAHVQDDSPATPFLVVRLATHFLYIVSTSNSGS